MSNHSIKIVILGPQNCGKACLLDKNIHNRLLRDVGSVGVAFSGKEIDVEGHTLTLGIYDTAGHEKYDSFTRLYCRGAHAAIVCIDLTDHSSFDRAKFWVNEMQTNEKHCRLYLCMTGKEQVDQHEKNKDLCQVDYDSVMDYGEDIRVEVFKTSSKTPENTRELFFKIAEDYVRESKTFK